MITDLVLQFLDYVKHEADVLIVIRETNWVDLLFKAFDADPDRWVDLIENCLVHEGSVYLDRPIGIAILEFSFVVVESIICTFDHRIADSGRDHDKSHSFIRNF